MKFLSAATLLSLSLLSVATPTPTYDAPLPARSVGRNGYYTVSGLGSRKRAITSCGGNVLDIAIGMLETDNLGTNYAYGDNKSSDSANFGIFKQNWGMLRQSVSRYKGKTANDWNTGAELNSNLCLDIQLRHESSNYYGESKWFAGHRNGQSGLNNPNTQDITNYRDAVYWIRDQLNKNSQYLTDDTRFWVDVPAI
ncbi:hypothetical protein BOTBODRAFT_34959 [Botryobasidium botryosum FD-172 SS1]|uniref:Uncharacterized protein n=1 Tax=Botryobasidium botryosum (strain FD-172 SS1) TaxID=930990 RepID=A0A067M8K4_BOTB1|nr:hypothetical protein BOTBODRAFT_34959 [Botryobasidium botryosum FD-172 SS1]